MTGNLILQSLLFFAALLLATLMLPVLVGHP
jgi:hypothetical protein